MRVTLDKEKCTGHGRCYTLSPKVFGDDPDGYGELIVDPDLPADLESQAQLAASNCPEQAITVTG